MSRYDDVLRDIAARERLWLVTGGAGFIGSHIVEKLLALGQSVRVLDKFSTGKRDNLDAAVAAGGAARLDVRVGDVADADDAAGACADVDIVLHQAALGSVPRSIENPAATFRANVDGTFAILHAAREAGVQRVVYASSSSVYGDAPSLPKVEDVIGRPLSPYAASKRINEITARVMFDTYGLQSIGLRYFNVFGPRQDPLGPYAAVIPKWTHALRTGAACVVNGDDDTSRDFCAVPNAVQANLLAALAPAAACGTVVNVAFGARTTLGALFALLKDGVARTHDSAKHAQLTRGPARAGDVKHSLADITRARSLLGYEPTHDVQRGIDEMLAAS